MEAGEDYDSAEDIDEPDDFDFYRLQQMEDGRMPDDLRQGIVQAQAEEHIHEGSESATSGEDLAEESEAEESDSSESDVQFEDWGKN